MPEYAAPFSGLASDRKLTDEEKFYIEGAEEVEEEIKSQRMIELCFYFGSGSICVGSRLV